MIDISVDYHSGIPVYRQVVDALSEAIELKQLPAGDRLPSIRELAEQLGINPNTTAKVYRELELRGLIESRPGSGCFVLPGVDREVSEREKIRFLQQQWDELMQGARKLQIKEQEVHRFLRRRLNR